MYYVYNVGEQLKSVRVINDPLGNINSLFHCVES